MSSYVLKLSPYYGADIELKLSDEPNVIGIYNSTIKTNIGVCSHYSFSAELIGNEIPNECQIKVYINGEETPIKQENNQITFTENGGRIFLLYIGLVQISVEIITDTGIIDLYSDYIPVLVRNNTTNDSIQRMAKYVYEHQENLLHHSKMPSQKELGVKDNTPQTLESQIQIIGRIVQVYSEQYRYFASNAKFKLKPDGKVDSFEKIQKVTSSTLTYITQHPEYLIPVSQMSGIRRNGRQYLPRKTLIVQNTPNYDIYENQAIIHFLKNVYLSIDTLIEQLDKRIFDERNEIERTNEYFNSTWFILEYSHRKLKNYKDVLLDCKSKVESLYTSFLRVLPVKQGILTAIPKPTAIFTSIPAYRLIYNQIVAWFRYGLYCFEREDFILPFLQTYRLYEYYMLLKLHQYFQSKGFEYQAEKTTVFRYPDLKYPLVSRKNTFVYTNHESGQEIALYYEPAIYGKKHVGCNNIGLFRNTSLSFDGKNFGLPYYTPDYIVKLTSDSSTKYIIMDAKLSDLNNIRTHQLSKLAYKYLFSLSTIDPNDEIIGMVLFAGRSDNVDNGRHNIYDLSPNGRIVYPFAEVLTITENSADGEQAEQIQFKLMDRVLGKVLFTEK